MTWLRRSRLRRKSPTWLFVVRAVVLALALPLMSSGALPFWAQLAGVEGPHVCHCSIDKHDCVCPRCNTDQHADAVTTDSLKGRCGDDEVAFGGGKMLAAISPLAAAWTPPIAEIAEIAQLDESPPPLVSSRPPVPPPRNESARAS